MRILALDVGKRRIGIAVSDPLGIIARPHSTIPRNKEAPLRIIEISTELEADRIIIGLPLHLDRTEGEQARDVRNFAARLTQFIPAEKIHFVDERLSTVEAETRLATKHREWQKRKELKDAFAAAIILETYLSEK